MPAGNRAGSEFVLFTNMTTVVKIHFLTPGVPHISVHCTLFSYNHHPFAERKKVFTIIIIFVWLDFVSPCPITLFCLYSARGTLMASEDNAEFCI